MNDDDGHHPSLVSSGCTDSEIVGLGRLLFSAAKVQDVVIASACIGPTGARLGAGARWSKDPENTSLRLWEAVGVSISVTMSNGTPNLFSPSAEALGERSDATDQLGLRPKNGIELFLLQARDPLSSPALPLLQARDMLSSPALPLLQARRAAVAL
jgi:hypothetical protein